MAGDDQDAVRYSAAYLSSLPRSERSKLLEKIKVRKLFLQRSELRKRNSRHPEIWTYNDKADWAMRLKKKIAMLARELGLES